MDKIIRYFGASPISLYLKTNDYNSIRLALLFAHLSPETLDIVVVNENDNSREWPLFKDRSLEIDNFYSLFEYINETHASAHLLGDDAHSRVYNRKTALALDEMIKTMIAMHEVGESDILSNLLNNFIKQTRILLGDQKWFGGDKYSIIDAMLSSFYFFMPALGVDYNVLPTQIKNYMESNIPEQFFISKMNRNNKLWSL